MSTHFDDPCCAACGCPRSLHDVAGCRCCAACAGYAPESTTPFSTPSDADAAATPPDPRDARIAELEAQAAAMRAVLLTLQRDLPGHMSNLAAVDDLMADRTEERLAEHRQEVDAALASAAGAALLTSLQQHRDALRAAEEYIDPIVLCTDGDCGRPAVIGTDWRHARDCIGCDADPLGDYVEALIALATALRSGPGRGGTVTEHPTHHWTTNGPAGGHHRYCSQCPAESPVCPGCLTHDRREDERNARMAAGAEPCPFDPVADGVPLFGADLDAIEARHAAATAGPWEPVLPGDPRGQPVPYYRGLVALIEHSGGNQTLAVVAPVTVVREKWEANARFIAAAWEDVRLLLDEVRRLRAGGKP